MELKQKYSKKEMVEIVWKDLDIPVSIATEETKLFKEYLSTGEVIDHPEKHNDMEIMFFLYKLGYKPEQLGTYLYKEIVKKLTYMIPSIIADNDKQEVEQLLLKLKNMYSNFYFDIAVNDLDMGLKTFHEIINKAKTTKDPADSLVHRLIYNGVEVEEHLKPLAIALYLNNINLKKEERVYPNYVPRLKHNNGECV